MNQSQIISALQEQRDHINEAITHLEALTEGSNPHRLGRPISKGRRHMSAEARARISRGMKLRWAQRKKKTSSSVHELPRRKAA